VKRIILTLISCLLYSTTLQATPYDNCILQTVEQAPIDKTAEDIKAHCTQAMKPSEQAQKPDMALGAISLRIKEERAVQNNRFAILAHKQNYILPITHTSKINRDAYDFAGETFVDDLDKHEAKIQLSIKVPLNESPIFRYGDGIYFGFTTTAWWQVYASEISAPFRETNYQPEIFYLSGLDWKPYGGNTGYRLGLEHQSNGKSQVLSRSWNRLYASLLFEKGHFAFELRPWYRLPEDKKKQPNDSDGDDNPDIEDYMGHFDFSAAYRKNTHEFTLLARNNLRSKNKGAIELGWSFPLFGHLKGFVQYFNGYGESMIDYNISQERIGLGILLTERL